MDRGQNFVRIAVNDEQYKMLKDLARFYGTDLAEIASVPSKAALEVFLEEQKRKYRLICSVSMKNGASGTDGHSTGF